MNIDTISSPMWDNFRELLKILKDQDIKYSKYRITYLGDRMEVLILSIIPKWVIVDNDGIYIDGLNVF